MILIWKFFTTVITIVTRQYQKLFAILNTVSKGFQTLSNVDFKKGIDNFIAALVKSI